MKHDGSGNFIYFLYNYKIIVNLIYFYVLDLYWQNIFPFVYWPFEFFL